MRIGPVDLDQRVLVVAEVGVNHEGDAAVAGVLVEAAARAGADAVKFQTYDPFEYVAIDDRPRHDRVARFALTQERFQELSALARRCGIMFLSTPLGAASADFLDPLVPAFKISSGDLVHLALVRHVAAKGKPLLLSTGMATTEEIDAAVEAVRQALPDGAPLADRLALLHCVTSYPAPDETANLLSIPYLRQRYGLTIGYSDHTVGTLACEAAVALGARVIEKHFTYRKGDQKFRDHALSADPADLAALVRRIRRLEPMLGRPGKFRQPPEAEMLVSMRRSLTARRDIAAGEIITAAMLASARPATGLPVEEIDRVIGCEAVRDIERGQVIRQTDLAAGMLERRLPPVGSAGAPGVASSKSDSQSAGALGVVPSADLIPRDPRQGTSSISDSRSPGLPLGRGKGGSGCSPHGLARGAPQGRR